MMNKGIKIGLYVVLVIAAIYFGHNFFTVLNAVSEKRPDSTEAVAQPPETVSPETTNVAVDENAEVQITETNDVELADTDNVPAETNGTTNVSATVSEPRNSENEETTGAVLASAGRGKIWGSLGKFLGVLLILGLLAAYDVTQYLGNRSVDFFFNDNLEGVHDPDYEQAEQTYANGKPLDAIQMLREYLRKNPRQQHAALRIAEIYEKDLGNYLAAALEYEEILTHKLPRERWGWAAIHLCNLYSKLGKSDNTLALLRRISEEYSETAAAKKARKRLAMFESVGDADALATDLPEDPNLPGHPHAAKTVNRQQKESPPSNLPPGFRPKK